MLQSSTSIARNWHTPISARENPAGTLATVVYRSTAARPLSPAELHDLTLTAQVRNDREGITGLLLYDAGRFFQWLEGPPGAINHVMRSIHRDKRHRDIEVLRVQTAQDRAFGAWSLKLAALGEDSDLWRRDVIEPPIHIIEGLRRRPDAAPAFLIGLVSLPAALDDGVDDLEGRPLQQQAASILKNVFLNAVIPMLGVADASRLTAPSRAAQHPRAAELAELLVSADGQAARDLFAEIQKGAGAIGPLAAALLEPAARSLGNLWEEDLCSEFDVTLGLCRLQSAVRLLSAGAAIPESGRTPRPVVLIAPEPGELHRLGAALDSAVLARAGWAPQSAFPEHDNALSDLVSATWFDVLDLSLSPAFRREQELPRLTKTIAEARRASRNPGLVVVVGGRIFLEEASAGAEVGADNASATAQNVNRTILRTISESRTNTASVSETLQVTSTPS